MALNSQITQLAELVAADLNGGQGTSRQSLGGGSEAFGWVGGLPKTIADFVATTTAEGMSIPVTTVSPSGTPAAVVGEGAPKPSAVTIATATITLVKHAGLGEATLEQMLNARGLLNAVATVLGAGALLSFEADSIAVLDAGAGATVTGADWVSAVTTAQAAVLGNGGLPNVLVVSHADYGALVGDISGSAGYAIDPTSGSAVGSLFGSLIHVSPKAAAGKAWVLDGESVLAVQHINSPVVVVDAVSQASTNKTRLVADLVAKTAILNPAHVVEITAPVTTTTASSSRAKK